MNKGYFYHSSDSTRSFGLIIGEIKCQEHSEKWMKKESTK